MVAPLMSDSTNMVEIRSMTAPGPANFTGGNNTYCDLQSRATLVDALSKDQHSIYKTVGSCRSACELFYGTGNPDISGVGVSISYIFQVGVTYLLFTIILTCRSYVRHPPRSARFTKQVERALRELVPITDVILATNLFLTLSLAAGTLVELNRYPFVFTLSFLKILMVIEPLITAAALLCRICLKKYAKADKAAVLTYLFALLTLVLLWLFIFFRYGVSEGLLSTYSGVVDACADIWDYPRYYIDQKPGGGWILPGLKVLGMVLLVGIVLAVTSVVGIGLVILVREWILQPLKRLISLLMSRHEDQFSAQLAPTSPDRFTQLGAGYLSKIADFIARHMPRTSILKHPALVKSVHITVLGFTAMQTVLRKCFDGFGRALKPLGVFLHTLALQPDSHQKWAFLVRTLIPVRNPYTRLPWWGRMFANSFLWPSILICSWAIPLTRDLEMKRLVVARASQDKFEDNVWGFGQVVAVLLWVPVVFQVMSSSIMFLRYRSRKGDEEQPDDESIVSKGHDDDGSEKAADSSKASEVEPGSSYVSGSEPSRKNPVLLRRLRSHGTWPLMDDGRLCDR